MVRKRVLMVAFHYPPVKGSSGVQRALTFSNYLRENGWEPEVLTVKPGAYVLTGDDQIKDIPQDMHLTRAIALDAKRHLSIRGSYPRFAGVPDRWSSWRFDGVRSGMSIIRKRRPNAIWSTFPIATAHRIGLSLARKSGIPWIADCRDSMSEEGYPSDPAIFKAVRSLESKVVHNATAVTFTAPSARTMYAERYPDVDAAKFRLIQNGYDEAAFEGLSQRSEDADDTSPLTLVHAGILYPNERDPRAFFAAIADLKRTGQLGPRGLRIVLRATGHDEHYRPMLRENGIDDIVELAPGVPYRDALQEMLLADGLLIFQAANCNHQIPAKAYEYLRAGRPVFTLTDLTGDTARLMLENGHRDVCPLDDATAIRDSLPRFLARLVDDTGKTPQIAAAQAHSRKARTAELTILLNEISA